MIVLCFLGIFLNAPQGAVEKSRLPAQAAESLENQALHRNTVNSCFLANISRPMQGRIRQLTDSARGQRRWPRLPGAPNKKQREAARAGARSGAIRLCMWPTVKRASRRVCQNDTLIRFPASSQSSYKPLKTHGNWMSRARRTLQKLGSTGEMGIPPPWEAALHFVAAATPRVAARFEKDHGYNWVRLRLFHTPKELPNNLEYTIALAQAEAEKEFETAIKMDGDSAGVECQLGEIAFLRSDLESAQAHYERAYALNQGDAEAQLGLGKVLMSTGKPQEAIKYLRMAVQSDPLDAQAHYRLGMAYKALKMADESRHELQLFQEIREAKGRVRQLYRQMHKQSRTLDEQLSGIDQ